MTGMSGRSKIIIGLLIGIVTIPLFIVGIVNLVTISATNIWGWLFIGFGFTLIILIATLVITIKGTTSSRYEAEFEV
ncbi:MAG: hypothetical protein ACTSPK_11810 [Candidatus Heimdallarchaeota archaeon]